MFLGIVRFFFVFIQFPPGSLQLDISIDLGEPFILFVGFNPTEFSFGFNFNGEDSDPLVIKNKPFGFGFSSVNVSVAMTINYVGFADPGKL